MFAKLYNRGESQCLVKLDSSDDDDTPEVRVYYEPVGFGVCSAAIRFNNDNDDGWEEAEKAFEGMTEEKAWAFAETVCAQCGFELNKVIDD